MWLGLVLVMFVTGCPPRTPSDEKPVMQAGTGAIEGKLVAADEAPFDLALAADDSSGPLRVELLSPARGVVATANTHRNKPEFSFSNVRPGTYELVVYRAIAGKRTIAGSQTVTVNPGETAPATLMLQVNEQSPR